MLQAGTDRTRTRLRAIDNPEFTFLRPMPLGEFDLIERYFQRPVRRQPLGIGDDCALLAPRPGMQWAVSTDLLVEGRHFLPTVDPQRLGHKTLAVNLSDLAACGAEPVAYTLSLALPRVDEGFLEAFARGLHALADAHGIELVGGDTTAGPLTLGITVMGEVPVGQALLRSGARAGDDLWVSHARHGGLGDARLALEGLLGTVHLPAEDFHRVRLALELPQPRVALGLALRGLATSAIDLSDGLMGDLAHVLKRSGAQAGVPGGALGAHLWADDLPCSATLSRQDLALRRTCQLSGGDDYELLFTAPADRRSDVQAASERADTAVQRIGCITAEPGLIVTDSTGHRLPATWASFDHFRSPSATPTNP